MKNTILGGGGGVVVVTNPVVCTLAERTEQWKRDIPGAVLKSDDRTEKASKTRSKGLRHGAKGFRRSEFANKKQSTCGGAAQGVSGSRFQCKH